MHTLLDVIGPQPAPPAVLVLVTGVLALATVATRAVWRRARTVVTIAHEGGHALTALLFGRKLRGIRLHSDTSGLTLSAGRPTGFGMAATLFAGYITPPLLGLGGAALLATGRIRLMLWLSLVLLLAMLVNIRNAYGAVAVIVVGAGVFAVSWYATPKVQAAFAYAAVWFLLLGGVRPVGELQRLRRRRQAGDSDADQLSRLTHVPALLWIGVFGAIALGALAYGAWLLAHSMLPVSLPSLSSSGQ